MSNAATDTAPHPPSAVARRLRTRTIEQAERLGLPGLLLLLVLLFTVLPATSTAFPTGANLDNITGNQSVLALIALAAIVPLICGEFDISVGPTLGFTSVLSAYAVTAWGTPSVVAILIGIAAGAGIGLVNGFLVARLGLNSLITTLAVGTVLAGAAMAVSSVPIIEGVPAGFSAFGTGDWLGLPRPFFVLVAVAFVLWFFLEQTAKGRELHAVGSSKSASRLVGLSVDGLVLRSFVLSGAISGAAGVLQLARSGIGDPNIGAGFTLPAIAAAFLGATAIRPGRFNVLGTIVAVFFLAVVVSGLSILGAEAWLQSVVNGGALLAGIAVSTLIARGRQTGA